ncbi:chorismate mutase [Sphingomonas sp. LY54]|uniref:chorismate mutase n=1 Tax=Sphingomonas sp. LY54 TaxID=3095343 RepID=UPI002D785FEC|nr:chorismate mutase [Sphingomonas sp. LY54]WRP28591.1 chorismate mutase [Sphingomonas sp. LY54]
MSEDRVKPAVCTKMAEVRHGVDRLDEQIVALLAERFRYMEAAARIKPTRDAVRDEARKAQVIANAAAAAAREGLDPQVAAGLYDNLVETSIAYEFERFDLRTTQV